MFRFVDALRTDEELTDGASRPTALVIAGPLIDPGPDEDGHVALAMTAFNIGMQKYVNGKMGWPKTTPLSLECQIAHWPSMTVTCASEYYSFAKFCIGRGFAKLSDDEYATVEVKVKPYVGAKSDSRILSPSLLKTKERPQVRDYKALNVELYAGFATTETGDEQGLKISRGKVGVWNERCNLIVALSHKLEMLSGPPGILTKREALDKVCKETSLEEHGAKLLLNPATGMCPYKFKDDDQTIECLAHRHVLGASNNLLKLVDKKQGHLITHHKDAASHRFAARLRLALSRPRITQVDLDSEAGEPIEAPLRDGLFDSLPDLFAPNFSARPEDAMSRAAWVNKEVRRSAVETEAEE